MTRSEGENLDNIIFTFDLPLQEPGSDQEIVEYVSKYGVQFDLFSKSDINGPNALTLYQVCNRMHLFRSYWVIIFVLSENKPKAPYKIKSLYFLIR